MRVSPSFPQSKELTFHHDMVLSVVTTSYRYQVLLLFTGGAHTDPALVVRKYSSTVLHVLRSTVVTVSSSKLWFTVSDHAATLEDTTSPSLIRGGSCEHWVFDWQFFRLIANGCC